MNKLSNFKTLVKYNKKYFSKENFLIFKFSNENKSLPDRNNKSKEAARSRRNRENDEFKYLAGLLPLQTEITKQLDKASIIRLTISYLKLRKFYSECNFVNEKPNNFIREKLEINNFVPSSLDGFLFLLGHDGKFLYINESVSSMLGLSQVSMIGTHIYDYIHPDDREEFSTVLGLIRIDKNNPESIKYFPSDYSDDSIEEENVFKNSIGINNNKVSMLIRFKSTLMKKTNFIKSSGWRLIQIIGRLDSTLSNTKIGAGFFGIGLAIETQSLCEMYLQNSTFILKLNSKLQIESIENFPLEINIDINEIYGKSIFHLVNPKDLTFFTEKLLEIKKKEHSIFLFRLAQSIDENLACQCNAFLIPKATFLPTNGNECSIIESFQIILVNELYRIDEQIGHHILTDRLRKQAYHNDKYNYPNSPNNLESNEIPEKNLPLKKNKLKMKTTMTNTINESYHKEIRKERARKYFKIDSPNAEKKSDQEFEEPFFKSSYINHNFFNIESSKQLSNHSIDCDFQNSNRFCMNDVDFTNQYSTALNDLTRNYDSSQSSQIFWDLVKQDETHSYLNLANLTNFSDQI